MKKKHSTGQSNVDDLPLFPVQCQLNVLEMQQMVSPKFVERFQQCSVSEGETVVLQCRAVGTPTPVLSWQKDGVSVENTQNVMVNNESITWG